MPHDSLNQSQRSLPRFYPPIDRYWGTTEGWQAVIQQSPYVSFGALWLYFGLGVCGELVDKIRGTYTDKNHSLDSIQNRKTQTLTRTPSRPHIR